MIFPSLFRIAVFLSFSSFSSATAFASTGPTNHFLGKRANMAFARRISSRRPDLNIPRGGDQETEATITTEMGSTLSSSEEEAAPTSTTTTEFSTNKAAVAVSPSVLTKLVAVFACAGKVYSQQLELRPILTKSYTAGLIFGLSDYFAQRIEGSNEVNGSSSKMNWTRTFVSTLVGLCYFGPAAHYWYEWIFRLLPSTSLTSTLYKAFWGQLIFGPSFTCIFFATSLIQSGDFTLKNWWKKIRNDLPGAWLAGIGFWPIVDFISYSMIPIKLIPLFINGASFIWTIYLSLVANRGKSSSPSA
jgi:protein Mpv17